MRRLLAALLFAIAAPAAGARAQDSVIVVNTDSLVKVVQDTAVIAQTDSLVKIMQSLFARRPVDPESAYADSLDSALRIAKDSLRRFPQPVPTSDVPDPRFFQMDDWVREYLASEWRKYALATASSVERGYCLTYQLDWGWNEEQAYRITKIEPANTMQSDVGSITFTCPAGPFKAELHVHPPSTCVSRGGNSQYCWFGGSDAYECFPSDGDHDHLNFWLVDDKFGALQCDEHAVVYWKPDPKDRQAAVLARQIIAKWRSAKRLP